MGTATIRDLVQVEAQPTVVRLDHLDGEDAEWISRRFYVTEEIERHLSVLGRLLDRDVGCGVFLIGHYGSGKSHFLAYVVQQVGALTGRPPTACPISLLNYAASNSLEAGPLMKPALSAIFSIAAITSSFRLACCRTRSTKGIGLCDSVICSCEIFGLRGQVRPLRGHDPATSSSP